MVGQWKEARRVHWGSATAPCRTGATFQRGSWWQDLRGHHTCTWLESQLARLQVAAKP